MRRQKVPKNRRRGVRSAFCKKNFLESIAVAIPKLIGRATKNARQQRKLDTGVFTKLSSKINSTNCNRSLYGDFFLRRKFVPQSEIPKNPKTKVKSPLSISAAER